MIIRRLHAQRATNSKLHAGFIFHLILLPPTKLLQWHLLQALKSSGSVFFIDEQPTPQAFTYHTPSLVYPLFIVVLLFVVCVKFHNSLKKEKGVGSRREGVWRSKAGAVVRE